MNIIFTSKNTKISGGIKAYVEQKIIPLEKIEGPIIDVEIIVVKEKIDYVSEIRIKTKLNSYQSKESHKILKQAIRESLTIIRKQIKKNKAMIKNKKRINRKNKFRNQKSKDMIFTAAPPINVEIVNNYLKKPVSVEEAVKLLKKSQENALLFKNNLSKKTSVVFYNSKNSVALIEEEK